MDPNNDMLSDDNIADTAIVLFIALCFFMPLGLWKIAELIVWAIKHFRA